MKNYIKMVITIVVDNNDNGNANVVIPGDTPTTIGDMNNARTVLERSLKKLTDEIEARNSIEAKIKNAPEMQGLQDVQTEKTNRPPETKGSSDL